MAALWLMFSGAFIAATLLPGGSEVLLIGFINQAPEEWLSFVIAASVGNTLGSISSYYLGSLGRFASEPERLAQGRYQKGLSLLQRYGNWAMLLAWAPIIGDVLCLLAGWLKLPIVRVSVMIAIGKTLRYLLIAAIALPWMS